jgi:hypothetical protein
MENKEFIFNPNNIKEAKLHNLKRNFEIREHEIFSYQCDIDNHERAIEKIKLEYKDNEDLKPFVETLKNLVEGNKREQLKTIIMRDVIKEQLFELTGDACFS